MRRSVVVIIIFCVKTSESISRDDALYNNIILIWFNLMKKTDSTGNVCKSL